MDIRQLRYLVSLSKERHFARAAEACGIAQPTLSAALRQLEDELGVPVVERGNRFKAFTPEGERVLGWARRILADCQSLEDELATLSGRLGGRLMLGAIPSALPHAGPLTSAFHARHPGVAITVESMTSIDIQRALDSFDLHAGLTYLDNEPLQHVRSLPLFTERHHLLAPADGPLAGRTTMSWSEAGELPLALLTPDMQGRRIVDAVFRDLGTVPAPVLESNSIVTLLGHVRAGGGCAVVPEGYVRQMPESDILALKLIEPAVEHSIGLVVGDREPMAPLAEALLQVARGLTGNATSK